MAAKKSAGLLMYRMRNGEPEIFLVHPGGPFFRNKDEGAWGIPKGLIEENEDPLETAQREFEEETGIRPRGPFWDLGTVKQKSGKVVRAWAFEGDWDESQPIRSNEFEMEWPPKSGKIQRFPEIDRAAFFRVEEARKKMNPAQVAFVDRLLELLENRRKGQQESPE